MEGIKRISGSITAFDIRENIKYYTTSFVEKKYVAKASIGYENWQFWILYCYTSFDVIFQWYKSPHKFGIQLCKKHEKKHTVCSII